MYRRNEECLTIMGSKYDKVLFYDDQGSYSGRTTGPRIKVLVKASTVIPERIKVQGTDGDPDLQHKILVIGCPNQCASCHTTGHNSRTCPLNPHNRNHNGAQRGRHRPRRPPDPRSKQHWEARPQRQWDNPNFQPLVERAQDSRPERDGKQQPGSTPRPPTIC